VSVNSEVPSTHFAFQHAFFGKLVNTLPPNTLQNIVLVISFYCCFIYSIYSWYKQGVLHQVQQLNRSLLK